MQTKLTPEVLESIRVDREEHGCTITALTTKYSMSRSTISKAITGLDDSKVQWASPSRKVVVPVTRPLRPPLSKTDLGEAARQMIAARLMLAGLTVFRPLTEDTPVDLLVLRKDGVALKCQCKCFYFNEDGSHMMNLTSMRKWGPNSKVVIHRYTKEEVDFFLGYVTDVDTIYVFPFDAVAHLKSKVKAWVLRQPKTNSQPFNLAPYKNAFNLMSP